MFLIDQFNDKGSIGTCEEGVKLIHGWCLLVSFPDDLSLKSLAWETRCPHDHSIIYKCARALMVCHVRRMLLSHPSMKFHLCSMYKSHSRFCQASPVCYVLTPRKLTLHSWSKCKLLLGKQCECFYRILHSVSSFEYWWKKASSEECDNYLPLILSLNCISKSLNRIEHVCTHTITF